jgi:large subunit ribosomal protein L21
LWCSVLFTNIFANFPRLLVDSLKTQQTVVSEDWEYKKMYAIIRTGGRQYRAEVGKTIDVERLPQEVGQSFDITDVLLVGDDDNTVIGQPLVEGASVKVTVVDQYRGKKVIVFKYRQRTNYRRKSGHRQYYTRLQIDEISTN